MRRSTGSLLAAVACLAVVALWASPPPAAAKVTRVVGSGTQAPDSRGAAVALCAAGKRLVGGGFALDPPYDPVLGTGAQTLVQEAFPGDARGWKLSGFATAGGTESTLYAVGMCRKGSIVRRSKALSVPAESHVGVRAICPKGRHATGGGYHVTPQYYPEDGSGSNISVHTSRRITERSWLVGATRDNGAAGTVVAHVFCESNWRGTVAERKESVVADDTGRYSATAKCPSWAKVMSGGFKARPLGTPGQSMTTGLFPWISANRPLLTGRGWTATVHNANGPLPTGKLTVYAYCS